MKIDVWSDFVCPWCFLGTSSLRQLQESHPVEVTWHSFELRPAGSPPISPEYLARIEAAQPQLKRMATEVYGIEINGGKFGIDSRPALIGEKYAETQGKGDAYHWAMFRAYWEDAKDISDEAVLREVAESVGLEGDAFIEALKDPAYNIQVTQDVYQAQQIGITGVPALLFAEKYLVSGAQPYESLVDILRQIDELEKQEAS